MLSLEVSTKSIHSPMQVSKDDDKESSLSFAQLLKGINVKDDEDIQNGVLTLSLDKKELVKSSKDSKNIAIKNLLLDKQDTSNDTLDIHSSIFQDLSPKEIKKLIIDAKKYLKNEILNSDGYKKAEIKELPKTLKGLTKLAKKFDIDITKITIQELSLASKHTKTILPSSKIALSSSIVNKIPVHKETKIDTLESMLKHKSTDTKETKAKKSILKHSSTEIKLQKNSKDEIPLKPSTTITKENIALSDTPSKKINILEKSFVQNTPIKDKEDSYKTKTQSLQQEITQTLQTKEPSKVQNISPVQDKIQTIVTKEIIQKHTTKKVKEKEDFSTLLRGEKVVKSNPNLTADFSVASATLIAPSAKEDSIKNLEKLLFAKEGEQNESSNVTSKHDNLNTNKTDSFEVKIQEAKQMMKYLSNDVKTAIEDYKSPFTKIKVQLNPQKLGEVDLTVVQRGKNLHVNINSNNTAINTLALNLNELKMQLSNNGINNATFNFSNTQNDSTQSNANGQHQHQNKQQAQKEYNYFESEEQNEEVLSSLEIIVPSYA